MAAETRSMPCLTLTQPWGSLVAHGLKNVETRSWRTSYRGQLAIHAAKGFPAYARDVLELDHFWRPLEVAGHTIGRDPARRGSMAITHDLPLGAVLATARLVRCVRTEDIAPHLSSRELVFGDYEPGRWAWELADVVRLPEPIPARGMLGLWDWQVPDGPAIDAG